MRIQKIHLGNFKKFSQQTFDLHPQFTLLVGDNGSGKTTVLDALAVALGVWLLDVPDSDITNSQRPIFQSEIRLEARNDGDRTLFREAWNGVSVTAEGVINDQAVSWTREIVMMKSKTRNTQSKVVRELILSLYERSQYEHVLLPVIAYYGAGRAWLPHRERSKNASSARTVARRWAAFYDCLNERIRIADLVQWFWDETTEAGNRQGRFRPGFEVVRNAILKCIPGADNVTFDVDRKDIILSIDGNSQPFANLSAGQKMMLALVADIAIKAVTQNNFLVPPDELNKEDSPLPRVLAQTPGVVLIDELDVHLHPRWQRRVVSDLKMTFPQIQFVCTSHSPQVIGQVRPDEIRLLDSPLVGSLPAHSFGLDSNAVLEEVQHADAQDVSTRHLIQQIDQGLDLGDLDTARRGLEKLRQIQNGSTRDTVSVEAMINNLEALSHEVD